MKLTPNSKVFALINVMIASLFYMAVNYYGDRTGDRSGAVMSGMALAAIIVVLLAAWSLLRHENERLSTIGLNLVYHLIAVVVAIVEWGVAYALSDYVQPIDLAWIVGLGGGTLLVHWLFTRNRTKGINSKKAFL